MNFVRKNNQLFGPFSDSQVRSGLKSGKLSDMDEIAPAKEGPWLALNDHPSFQAHTKSTAVSSNDLGLDELLELESNAPAKTLAPVNPTAYASAATGGNPRHTTARGFGTNGDSSDAGQKALERLDADEREQRRMEEEHKRELATKAVAGIGIAGIGVLLFVGGIAGFVMFMRQNTKDVEAMVQPGIDRWLENQDEQREYGTELPDTIEGCRSRCDDISEEIAFLNSQIASQTEQERNQTTQRVGKLIREHEAVLKKWEKLEKEEEKKRQKELDNSEGE